MRTIGLLGGMSFESSVIYYRLINELVRNRMGQLHSAKIILYSVDFQQIVDMQKAALWHLASEHLAAAARSLERAGAECVVICTNTMHLVAGAIKQAVDIPLLDIIEATASRLQKSRSKQSLLLATRYTMEHGFYTARMRDLGLEIRVPDERDRATAHQIIFDELCAGRIEETSRAKLIAMIEKARAAGADAVILGCTELGLILNHKSSPLPVFDSTAIHCETAVNFALTEVA